MDKDTDDGNGPNRMVLYWQLLGKVIAFFCVPIILFTVFLALRMDGIVEWNYWMVFSPLFATLLGFILSTASQTLSSPAPVLVRVIWMTFVISITVFVVFLVLRLQDPNIFNPSLATVFMPLYPL